MKVPTTSIYVLGLFKNIIKKVSDWKENIGGKGNQNEVTDIIGIRMVKGLLLFF